MVSEAPEAARQGDGTRYAHPVRGALTKPELLLGVERQTFVGLLLGAVLAVQVAGFSLRVLIAAVVGWAVGLRVARALTRRDPYYVRLLFRRRLQRHYEARPDVGASGGNQPWRTRDELDG